MIKMKKRLIKILDFILGSRFWALFCKEVAELMRNDQLMFNILVTPAMLLILFGFAFNPKFEHLKLGITDYSNTLPSREFIEIFQQTNAFQIEHFYYNQEMMIDDLIANKITFGVVIPPEFDVDIAQNRSAQVQLLYDAVDANTISVASSYVEQLVSDYNVGQLRKSQSLSAVDKVSQPLRVQPWTSIMYNPGLKSSWFIVSGMIGVVLTTVGSQTASSLVVQEKEVGTIEQLMMTPASNTEVIFAKIFPLLIMLTFDAIVALIVSRLVFGLPLQGNLFAFLVVGIIYFWVSISIGILLASFTKSEQQCFLLAFFISPPLIITSGAITPISGMPIFMQWLTYLNPLRYLVEAYRSVLMKGVGIETVWTQILALLIFALILTTISILQFRRQLR